MIKKIELKSIYILYIQSILTFKIGWMTFFVWIFFFLLLLYLLHLFFVTFVKFHQKGVIFNSWEI
jgi:hypothetical protein